MAYLNISSFHMCFHLMKLFFTFKKKEKKTFEDHRTVSSSICHQWTPIHLRQPSNWQSVGTCVLTGFLLTLAVGHKNSVFTGFPESILSLIIDPAVTCGPSQVLPALHSFFFSCCSPLFKAHYHH